MQNTIYLDHAATSPVAPEVIEVMARAMADESGNASSIHTVGRQARKALDEARAALAKKLTRKQQKLFSQVAVQKPIIRRFSVQPMRDKKKASILLQHKSSIMPYFTLVKNYSVKALT